LDGDGNTVKDKIALLKPHCHLLDLFLTQSYDSYMYELTYSV